MAILVTGGAGFIGSNLCDLLLAKGEKVINLDNFNDYYDPKLKFENTKNNMENENYKLVKGDIRDLTLLDKLFSTEKINAVIHLAAMAGVRPSIEDPLLYQDVNIRGTMHLLEMCKNYGVKKFIFASSSSVYGNNKTVPFTETDVVDFSISPYAATKKSGEVLCHVYHDLYNLDIISLRFFTVYGPRQRPDLAIHKFTKLIKEGKEIPFYGDGSTKRDYTYIDDIIDGIVKSLEYLVSNTNVYEILNLGESRTISLKEMVNVLENELSIRAKLNSLPMQPGDVNSTFANIYKAQTMIGYDPKTDFEQGINKFIKWFNNNY
ncbi:MULTISPECIES: GDP-mannose 4,6-dehydratase [Peribacillus]|uniref:GDP-mannose 4,6-dehydratase n=1 Tax=Peribacillus TaxID=2675229 RepID=UPI001F4DE008|nr:MULTISPECIES: GDP-mannose 4,6-dehydratase [unclassified Peribacillus]MCK1981940.1 GDP-mannose 4,6-dehydratase [Peribacillus sp. Aquil_B1]MCK2010016.1 GDP-mannose 4,6-dehydratase [Peribacillus sp. Aquil_B8]